MESDLDYAVGRLEGILLELDSVVVGFSGGIDSTYLAVMANKVLGNGATKLVTADSPSLPRDELQDCQELAELLGLDLTVVRTAEFENGEYLKNDALRCFYCKSELMDALGPIARERGSAVVLGVNYSDRGDYRPGQRAASEKDARFPLLEAQMTKAMIRDHAKLLGIPNHDKAQAACLSSRVPYGTPITLSVLSRVERAERYLKSLGLTQVRVRDYDTSARIEVNPEDLQVCAGHGAQIDLELKALGYRYVTLDLGGFASGNLNSALSSDHMLNVIEPAPCIAQDDA